MWRSGLNYTHTHGKLPIGITHHVHLHAVQENIYTWGMESNVHLPEKLSRKVAPKCHILLLVSQQQVR
jgi:hypothetical protein